MTGVQTCALPISPLKKSLLSSLEGKALVEKTEFARAADEKQEVIRKANLLIGKNKEIAEAKANILKIENQIEALIPWLTLDVPMNLAGTRKTALLIGTVAAEVTVETLYEKLAQVEPEPVGVDIQVIYSDKDMLCLAVICLKTDEEKVEEALRLCGFAKPSQVIQNTPARQKEILEAEIEKLKIGRAHV